MTPFYWGNGSLAVLSTVIPEWREIANECLRRTKIDITATCGRRGKEEQNKLYNAIPQRTKAQWPDSPHNVEDPEDLAIALDFHWIIPWPSHVVKEKFVKTLAQWYMWTQFVTDVAYDLGYEVQSGSDWDRDGDIQDQSFDDLPHFKYIGKIFGHKRWVKTRDFELELSEKVKELEESERKLNELTQKVKQYGDLQMELFNPNVAP